jgi:hypothetical protein
LKAQYTQSISGKIIDEGNQKGLPFASVIVSDLTPPVATIANEKGEFRLNNIPIGRRTIEISFLGYETLKIPSVMLNSGKELVLNVEIKESITSLKEVVITSTNKHKPQNAMASISARSFSVEETRRYAGGLDDPGRLVSVFAGVSDGNVESNGIIVRGNNPSGVVYRIEGVDVGNPNHFAGEDLLGGGFVSVLSNHVLGNSDFFTGAFPAEYGNALSAVFDMKLRNGNTNQFEHSVQVGALGIDLSSEGPIDKERKSSYVANYRYSTFGLMGAFLPEDSGLPEYQDISFKLNFPKKNGTISIWGTGGLDAYKTENIDDKYQCGIGGLNFKQILNESTYLNTSLAVNVYTKSNRLYSGLGDEKFLKHRMENMEGKYTLSTYLNKKFGKRHQNRTGINVLSHFYSFDNKLTESQSKPFEQLSDTEGNDIQVQVFSQSKYNINDKLAFTPGIHFQYFGLNKNYSYEPRIGINYAAGNRQTISFAYGKHSQTQMLALYFVQKKVNNTIEKPNLDLDFTTAHHFIGGYEMKINENLRLKIEPYLQLLRDVPVIADSSFSTVNLETANTFNEALVNKGTGRNIGIDFTLERFLKNNFYYLFTASVFDSKYKGGDGIERNTRFNKNFIVNALGGKEWVVGKKKTDFLGINGRLYIKGGDRHGTMNQVLSQQANELIYNDEGLFDEQYPVTGRCDLSVTYTRNKQKTSNIFALQVLNVTGSAIRYYSVYSSELNSMIQKVERFIMPSVSWKIEF